MCVTRGVVAIVPAKPRSEKGGQRIRPRMMSEQENSQLGNENAPQPVSAREREREGERKTYPTTSQRLDRYLLSPSRCHIDDMSIAAESVL